MPSFDTSTLDSSLATLNILLDISIASVVIGLVLEYAPALWSRMVFKIHHVRVGKIGELLVILGVAGELAIHIRSAQIDDKIKSAQRTEIIALQTKLAPRSLSGTEIVEIAARLEKFAGQEFAIASYGGEPLSFARRLRTVLDRSNWKYFEPDHEILLLPGSVGIEIDIQSDAPPAVEAAEALKAALVGIGIEALTFKQSKDKASAAKIEILVGGKF